MTTTVLAPRFAADTAGVHARPGLGRLVAVELRKIVDTRAGFWMQVAIVALTVLVVAVALSVGVAADHTFAAVLDVAVFPAAGLLPVAGILLVTSEWSQRTGMITFTLVPVRSRILGAKIIASLALCLAMLAVCVVVVAAGVLVSSPPVDAPWADAGTLIAQTAVYLIGGILTGVAFGAAILASAPAIVALFAAPITWTAVASLSLFAGVAPWTDTRLALAPLHQEALDTTQWAQVGTALALWMLLPLLIGTWRITRREGSV
jgi:ABC-type transport system involved in multi-copper enzyme maturation permease subunit